MKLTEAFNTHYINIVENSTAKKPSVLGNPSDLGKDRETVVKIVKEYNNHPSFLKIKIEVKSCVLSKFSIQNVTAENI